MKVLWFANTACSATKKLGLPDFSGGWLSSLELELNKVEGLELGICFYVNEEIAPFIYNNTHFFPVCREGKKSKITRYLFKLFKRYHSADKRELKKLKQIVDSYRPDLLHIHGTEDNFGLLLSDTVCPAVVSLQGVLTAYTGYYFKGVPLSVCRAHEKFIDRLMFGSFAAKYAVFVTKAKREQKILKAAKHVLGRTAWDKQLCTELAPNARYFVSNEILRSAFYNSTWNKQQFSEPLQLVSTISDSLYKGFETIVNTCMVLQQNKHFRFNWNIIGLRRDSETVKLIADWKKIDNLPITFCGPKNENEMVEILQSSDIYIQSSHIENSPNSLCEAMMLGMPIITSRAGGTTSLAEDKIEAILYESGDHKFLAEAIVALKTDFVGACKMGQAARARAVKRHDKKTIVTELAGIYQELTKNKNA